MSHTFSSSAMTSAAKPSSVSPRAPPLWSRVMYDFISCRKETVIRLFQPSHHAKFVRVVRFLGRGRWCCRRFDLVQQKSIEETMYFNHHKATHAAAVRSWSLSLLMSASLLPLLLLTLLLLMFHDSVFCMLCCGYLHPQPSLLLPA